MKMLSIRQWMMVGVAIFLTLAALFYHLANLFDQNVLQPTTQQQTVRRDAALDAALSDVAANSASWRDPKWQDALQARLQPFGARLLVLDPSGAEVFHTGHATPAEELNRQIVVVDGGAAGGRLGTIDLLVPRGNIALPLLAALLAVSLALMLVRTQMGKYVVKPLEAMSAAARQIAGGNLEFALPASRVREVADVREAFDVMGHGLRASIKRQAEVEEERRFFIGAIAHDLRTPLFSLRGYLEGLEQGLASSPEKAARYIEVCRQKADQLDRLVSDLFAFAKVEYLDQTLRCGPVDVGSLLDRAVEGARARARDKDVSLKLEGPSGPCVAKGDLDLLERAVDNLLDNAVRYTPSGGSIEVTWRGEPDKIIFTVADSGPGIDQSDMPHLFDPLYRGESSRNRQTGGAGLGLAIARRALLAHGGDLVAANRAGGGAEFSGWLPQSRDQWSVVGGQSRSANTDP
jgi:signal transduction histidine kinase